MANNTAVSSAAAAADSQSEPEQRTSRMELLWPPSVRNRVLSLAAAHGVSINEVVLQCIEVGLSSELVLQLIQRAAARRSTNSRFTRTKEGTRRAP
jgi:hypothetical protein